jgi:hypothetical protein
MNADVPPLTEPLPDGREALLEHILRWVALPAVIGIVPSLFVGHYLGDFLAGAASLSGWLYVWRGRSRPLPYVKPMRIIAWCGTAVLAFTTGLATAYALLVDWTM